MNKIVSSLLLPLALTAVASSVAFAQTTVSDCNLNGWTKNTSTGGVPPSTGTVSFVSGPGTPPIGSGSGQLSTGANGNGSAEFRNTNNAGTPVASLTELKYSTYILSHPNNSGQNIYILMTVDLDGNPMTTTDRDLFFFEPEYQSAAYAHPSPQQPVAMGVWQEWDALNGWWYTAGGLSGSGPGTNVKQLSTILSSYPSATILSTMRFVAGFGAPTWNNFVGNLDAVKIGVGGTTTTYNFELSTGSTWYADADNDGYGNPNVSTQACTQPAGYVANNTDCNDANPAVNPGATEVCDGIDNDCDNQVDEGVKTTFYADTDNDGYGDPNSSVQACSAPPGYVANNYDCNDQDGKKKVIVCHNGSPLCVNENAIGGHLGHGDVLGPCPGARMVQPSATEFTVSNFPNPFSKTTTIAYTLPSDSRVSLQVVDMAGRVIATLLNGDQEAGHHQVAFDGSGLSAGLYYYTLSAEADGEKLVRTNKMLLSE